MAGQVGLYSDHTSTHQEPDSSRPQAARSRVARAKRCGAALRLEGAGLAVLGADVDVYAVDLDALFRADEDVAHAVNDARLDQIGALGIDADDHIGRFDAELFRLDDVHGA